MIDRCPKLYLLKYGMQAFLQIRVNKCLPEKFYAIFYTIDQLQKWICRTVILPLLNPQLIVKISKHFQNVISTGITLVDAHLNWLNWFHFLFIEVGLLFVLIVCMIFLSPFLDVTRICMSKVSLFPARLWNSLPMEYFSLTYDLNGFKSRISRYLLTLGSF